MNHSLEQNVGMIRTAVRTAITRSGRSQASICRETGIFPNNLSQFLNAKRRMQSDALDKLFEALHLTIVIREAAEHYDESDHHASM